MSHVTAGKKSETSVNKKDFWNTSDLALDDAKVLCGVKYFSLDACATSLMESKGADFIRPVTALVCLPVPLHTLHANGYA